MRPELTKVAIICPQPPDAFTNILLGIGSVVLSHGWVVGMHWPHAKLMQELRESGVHAIVIIHLDPPQLPEPVELEWPCVAVHCDWTCRAVRSVMVDDQAVGALAAREFIARGFCSLASLGLGHHPWSVDRAQGFRAVARAAGVRYMGYGDEPQLSERAAFTSEMAEWMASLPRSTGVLACCDGWGRMACECALTQGRAVPEDLAFIGVDNQFFCALSHPPLSSVALPWRRMGERAGQWLAELLDHTSSECLVQRLPPVSIAIRHSSDALAVGDPEVSAALQIIRAHARRPLQVATLLRALPVDRRRLEARFRQLVGRTIIAEIRRVHVEEAKRMLAITDLDIASVARRSGFGSSAHLCVAFRQEMGMRPTTYRTRFQQSVS